MFEIFPYIYVNGTVINAGQPSLLATDPGLLYGYGLFETVRLCNGKTFMFNRHFERLLHSANILDISVSSFKDNLENWVIDYISILNISDGALRITLTKGIDEPNVILTSRAFGYNKADYETGFSATVSSVKRNENSPLANIKSLNYLDNLLAKKWSEIKGYKEAILLNSQNHVCECSMSNIFFVKNGVLHTPSIDCGVLNGITRAIVIKQISPILGIDINESKFSIEEMLSADEAFLTNSVMGIMPLVSIDGLRIGTEGIGVTTKKIMSDYNMILYDMTQ